jgi:hypothetical protein
MINVFRYIQPYCFIISQPVITVHPLTLTLIAVDGCVHAILKRGKALKLKQGLRTKIGRDKLFL